MTYKVVVKEIEGVEMLVVRRVDGKSFHGGVTSYNFDINDVAGATACAERLNIEAAKQRREIAETILEQLGGGHFCAMVGANRLTTLESGLCFHIGRNSKAVNVVEIKLLPSDTYEVRFYGRQSKLKKTVTEVYCDELQSVFEENTGMVASMFPRVYG